MPDLPKFVRQHGAGYEYGYIIVSQEIAGTHKYVRTGTTQTIDDALKKSGMGAVAYEDHERESPAPDEDRRKFRVSPEQRMAVRRSGKSKKAT